MPDEELPLFEIDNKWQTEWQGMPEFNITRVKPILTIKINFRIEEDIRKFEEITGIKILKRIENYWYPKLNIKTNSDQVYVDKDES